MKHIKDIIAIKRYNKIENTNPDELNGKDLIIRITVFGSIIIITALFTLWVLI